jgi:hypothetical protein
VLKSGTVIILGFKDVYHKGYRFEKTMTGKITSPLNAETRQRFGR